MIVLSISIADKLGYLLCFNEKSESVCLEFLYKVFVCVCVCEYM